MHTVRRLEATNPLGHFLNGMLDLGGSGSMAALSRESGLSTETFRNCIKGRSQPGPETQQRIARTFKLTLEQCIEFGLPKAAEYLEAAGAGSWEGDTTTNETPEEQLRRLMGNLAVRALTGPPLNTDEVDLVLSVYGIPRISHPDR